MMEFDDRLMTDWRLGHTVIVSLIRSPINLSFHRGRLLFAGRGNRVVGEGKWLFIQLGDKVFVIIGGWGKSVFSRLREKRFLN
jgi:hypothetical protein